MLAAIAPATSRVTIGTAALMPVLRRPVQAAQALASIDLLSGGRLTVAVGAGFPGPLGRPLHDLSGGAVGAAGSRGWTRPWPCGVSCGPATGPRPSTARCSASTRSRRPRPRTVPGGPAIWLGGASPSALARAGRRYDGWLPYPPDPADYATGLAQVRQAALDAGRAAEAVTPALFASVLIADDAAGGRAALEDFSRANYRMPLERLEAIQVVLTGPPEYVAAGLGRYIAAGARHLVCRIAAPTLRSQREQLERIAGIFPLLRGGAG